MPSETKTILVVDDEEAVLGVLRSVLQREQYEVVVAQDGEQAIDRTVSQAPHLIVLDLGLPKRSGLEVLEDLRKWYRAPILCLSGWHEEKTIVRALELGADDYVIKPIRRQELVARIRRLFQRYSEPPTRQPILRAGDIEVDLARRRVIRAGEEIRLTRTEFEILVFLVQNIDCVVTFNMLMDRIWGPSHGDYAQTLRVHIGHIRQKLHEGKTLPRYIFTEPGVGYRFSVPQEQARTPHARRTPSRASSSGALGPGSQERAPIAKVG